MKPNPGDSLLKYLLVLLLLVNISYAEALYEWSVKTSKSSVSVNEAVELHYTCRFSDEGSLYTIEFKPPKETDAYRLYALSEKERITEGIRTNEYRFIVFAKQSGRIDLSFEALMRRTTKASIENTVIGRDNVEDIEYTDTNLLLPNVVLDVKRAGAALSGRFTLDMKLDKQEAGAYEPLHLTLSVEGEGNFDQFVPFAINIADVQVFAEAPEKSYHLSERGFSGKVEQRFALVAHKDFRLDAFELEYFDLNEQRVKKLRTEITEVTVSKAAEAEELLDNDEEEASSREWDWSYLNYLLTLLTGFILGRWLRRKPLHKKRDETFIGQIRESESVKKLLTVLVLSEDIRFAELIVKLEKNPNAMNLVKVKKEALLLLDAEEEWDIPLPKNQALGGFLHLLFMFIKKIVIVSMTVLRLLIGFVQTLSGKKLKK